MIAINYVLDVSLKYVQENNMSQPTRFIIYWGRSYRYVRAWAIFGELPVHTVCDSRRFKVMISLRFKLPDYNCYGYGLNFNVEHVFGVNIMHRNILLEMEAKLYRHNCLETSKLDNEMNIS